MGELNAPSTALDLRDVIKRIVRSEIAILAPPPRWGTVLDINHPDRTARVLFPGDTDPAIVQFSTTNAPTRGLGTDPTVVFDPGNPESVPVGETLGDVVKVEGTIGNLWITDVVSGTRNLAMTFVQDTEPIDYRVESGPYVLPIRQINDIWVNTADGNAVNNWDGSAWQLKDFGTTAIGPDAITTAKIAALAVTGSELAAGAVIAGKIAAGTIVAADIAAGTITANEMATGTITAVSGIIGDLDAGVITAGTLELSSGSTTASFDGTGVSVVTGATILEMTATEFSVANGTSSVVVDELGVLITASSTVVTVNDLGMDIAFTDGYSGFNQYGLVVADTALFLGVHVTQTNFAVSNPTRSCFMDIDGVSINLIRVPTAHRGRISNLTASSAASCQVTVTFPISFPASEPPPTVHLNIPVSPATGGAIPRLWHVRAVAITRDDFICLAFSADSSNATFTDQLVDWSAIGGAY